MLGWEHQIWIYFLQHDVLCSKTYQKIFGIELLENHLCDSVGYHPQDEGVFIARRRHLDALERAHTAIDAGYHCLEGMGAGELLAEELRQAQHALGEITGTFTNEDLLDKIFSSFCIGK